MGSNHTVLVRIAEKLQKSYGQPAQRISRRRLSGFLQTGGDRDEPNEFEYSLKYTGKMHFDEPSIQDSLLQMIRRMSGNPPLRDDLQQEGLIHFWLTKSPAPG